MSHQFDATLKDIVAERLADFADVFDLPKTQPATILNVDLSTISAATDVALGFGDPIGAVVDLNFQSGPDRMLPARLLLYNAMLHSRYQVPIRSIVVLLRPRADSATLTGELAYGQAECRLEFHYSVIRLWQQSVEDYLGGGLGTLPLATLCKLPADQSGPGRDAGRGSENREASGKRDR